MPGTEAYQPLAHDESSKSAGDSGALERDAIVEEHTNDGYKDDASKDGVFRDRPWSSEVRDAKSDEGVDPASEQGHVALHQIRSKSSGSASSDSFLGGESEWDDDDDDDEDDAEVARYHMRFQARNDVPLPAEFRKASVWEFLRHAFTELQTNARHRRAARLLNMPSQSRRHQFQAAFVTWCCDGTELAILLAFAWMFAWILMGFVAGLGRMWWMTGFLLFLIRISSRRSIELLQGRRKRRQRLPTAEAMELGHAGIWSEVNPRNGRR